MPDKLREIRIKCPASHTFLSCSILIPLSLNSRKDMLTNLSHIDLVDPLDSWVREFEAVPAPRLLIVKCDDLFEILDKPLPLR